MDADEYAASVAFAANYANSSQAMDSRYSLCNLSRYASVPICGANGTGPDDFKPDYSHGFAMERIISIVVRLFRVACRIQQVNCNSIERCQSSSG